MIEVIGSNHLIPTHSSNDVGAADVYVNKFKIIAPNIRKRRAK